MNLYEVRETYNGVRVFEIAADSEEEAVKIAQSVSASDHLLYDDGDNYNIDNVDLVAEGIEPDLDIDRDYVPVWGDDGF